MGKRIDRGGSHGRCGARVRPCGHLEMCKKGVPESQKMTEIVARKAAAYGNKKRKVNEVSTGKNTGLFVELLILCFHFRFG